MGRQGVLKVVTGTNPAANVEVTETVPAGKYWQLLSCSVTLVQGATQTPNPALWIDDGTNTEIVIGGFTTAQSVSTTVRYHWGADFKDVDLTGTSPDRWGTKQLPSVVLLSPGWRVRTVTAGKGANTDYGAPRLVVIEYDTVPGTEYIVS
jgi:hypothetical protein